MPLKIWKCRTWAGGTDPDPSDLYHTDRPMNEMRTVLPKSDKLLDDALDTRLVKMRKT